MSRSKRNAAPRLFVQPLSVLRAPEKIVQSGGRVRAQQAVLSQYRKPVFGMTFGDLRRFVGLDQAHARFEVASRFLDRTPFLGGLFGRR